MLVPGAPVSLRAGGNRSRPAPQRLALGDEVLGVSSAFCPGCLSLEMAL